MRLFVCLFVWFFFFFPSKWQEEMLRLEEEYLVDPDVIPLTLEEVSVRILKPKSD